MRQSSLFVLRMPPPFGGGEIVSELLYNGLKNNYNFYLIRREDHSKSKQQNISLNSYLHGVKYIIGIIKHIQKTKPTKIFIGLPKTFGAFLRNAIIIQYCYFKKIKIYAELHGMSFPFLNNSISKFIFGNTINKIQKIRVLSNSIKDYLTVNGYKHTIVIIDNAIERPEFIGNPLKKLNPDKLRLLYLGLISESKGFTRLLEITRILHEKNVLNIKMNIIGEWHSETYKSMCMEKIDKYNIQNYFNFHGPKYNSDKWEYMYNNDMIIHLTQFDGQPLSLIECMSLGIPAISTRVGAIPEMITDCQNGFLIEKDEEVIDILVKVSLKNIDLPTIKNNCIETYNHRFTPEILYARMIEFMDA